MDVVAPYLEGKNDFGHLTRLLSYGGAESFIRGDALKGWVFGRGVP
jgi:hypothetical protein